MEGFPMATQKCSSIRPTQCLHGKVCNYFYVKILTLYEPESPISDLELITIFVPTCRCNDVLELVQTTQHFRLLADAAEIGGAGTQSLDALVREIHSKYSTAMDVFFLEVNNVLAIDGSHTFERAFFSFRTIVKVCVCCFFKLKVRWFMLSNPIFVSFLAI